MARVLRSAFGRRATAAYGGIIGRAEDWQRGNPANVPAAVLPGEGKDLRRD